MRILYISLIIIVIDQITKFLVKGFNIPFLGKVKGISYHSSIEVIHNFIYLTKVENYGIAFGLEFGNKFRFIVIILTIISILILLAYLYLIREKSFKIRLSVALIIAGAFGNLIDRIFYAVIFNQNGKLFQGKVVDFIQIKLFEFSLFGKTIDSLPIFNIADLSILAGVLMILYYSWKSRYLLKEKETQNPENESDSENQLSEGNRI